MVKGFILEYDKREGLIYKKVKEWEGSLRNNEKGRGFWAKSPFFSLLQGRRAWAPVAALAGSPGHGGGRGHGTKREGGSWGRLPPSISGKKARREGSHGGGRQQAAAAVVAPLRGSTAAKERRESERKPLGPCSLPWLGLGRSEVGCPRGPAVASRGARGGGAAELGRRRAMAGMAVVVGKRCRGLLIGVGRRWGGGRVGGGPASSAERL